MATRTQPTRLTVRPRPESGSRANRRLRREGLVPGVVYGGGQDPLPFAVDARELRLALQGAGAVLEIDLDGRTEPAVLQDQQVHPVRGETVHVDLLRVDLSKPISQAVVVELDGADDAPGTREGGVLEQVTREVHVEALPSEIPDLLRHDVSSLQLHDTITLEALELPSGVTLLDDPETVLATVTLPRMEVETPEEVETETEVVGEGEGEAFAAETTEAEAPSEGEAESGEAQ